MLEKLIQKNKGSLIATLLLMVAVFASVQLVFLTYSNNLNMQRRYEGAVQSASDLETGRDLSLWEINQAGGSWDTNLSNTTYDSSCRFPNAYLDVNGFYRLPGYKFRAKVKNNGGIVSIYVHAFKREVTVTPPPKYEYSRYAEYLYTPIPTYEYYMFSNANMEFGDSKHNVNGGRIHSNKNITFSPRGSYSGTFGSVSTPGIVLDKIRTLTANGTIKYGIRVQYPSPISIDGLDQYDENFDGQVSSFEYANATTVGPYPLKGGMAPAPFHVSNDTRRHEFTTSGIEVTPNGPFGYDYGSWLRGDGNNQHRWARSENDYWINGAAPMLWRGEESMFYGMQFNGSYYTSYMDETGFWYLDKTTNTSRNASDIISYECSNTGLPENCTHWLNSHAANTTSFWSGFNLFMNNVNNTGAFHNANVVFKPFKNDLGINNTGNEWFEIPGALPQAYQWTNKYSNSGGVPVKFYVTENCTSANAGCIRATSAATVGWRYRRINATTSVICSYADNNCYNDTNNRYIPADNATNLPATPYYAFIITRPGDRNDQFFGDNHTYGNDSNNPTSIYRQIHVFDAAKQDCEITGFPYYNSLLRMRGYGNVIAAPIAKKVFDLGQLFDGATDSKYKLKAMDDGIYVNGVSNSDAANAINTRVGSAVANPVQFVNWRTGEWVYLVNIDVGALGTAGYPHNGIIYSKWPLRLSNAANLPGTNDGNRKAVFTVLCEESIYLKGNYNTGGTDPLNNWKISNIATKKIIYALSNVFTDPQARPDFLIYHHYKGAFANITAWDNAPNVYLQTNTTGGYYFSTAPNYREGNPTIDNGDGTFGNGAWCDNMEAWMGNYVTICGSNDLFYSGQGPYNFVGARSAAKQADWIAANPVGPNSVNTNYYYNSLFITPYTFRGFNTMYSAVDGGAVLNTQLENWTSRTLYSNASMVYLYDPSDPNSNDEYMTSLNATEEPFDYRTAPHTPDCWACYRWSIARFNDEPPTRVTNYEARFPQVTPKNYEAVLGLTGESVWRQVSENYFLQETQ
jgi:hypothetical protein